MASDKAKGKRRAVDVPDTETSTRSVVVRFTDGDRDLTVHVGPAATARDVKDMIRSAREHLSRRRLRLIHAGRLLADKLRVVEWLDGLKRRAASAAAEDDGSPPAAATESAWLHCAVGPELADGEEEEESVPQEQARARGFDRLAAAGFSAEDIENMRTAFHARQATTFALSGALDSEAADEHARALEEQWMDDMQAGGGGEPEPGGARTSPIVLGLLCGFFFPLLPLFFLKAPPPPHAWPADAQPSVIFSRRMQIGIMLGLGANVLFAAWRSLIAVDDQHL